MQRHVLATTSSLSILAFFSACAGVGISGDGASVAGNEDPDGMAASDGAGVVGNCANEASLAVGDIGCHGVQIADSDRKPIGRAPQEGNGRFTQNGNGRMSLMDKAGKRDKGNGLANGGQNRSGGSGEGGDDVGNGITDSGTDIGG